MKNLQGKLVEIVSPIHCMGHASIPAGLTGRVEWDEGSAEIIVEFEREVPNGGYLPNKKQMWIPRSSVSILNNGEAHYE